MELPVTDDELDLIITTLPTGSPLRDRLTLISRVRQENPNGPWKAILRTEHNMVI